jgi:DNA-binding LacI/PurR family transcriptional regulator
VPYDPAAVWPVAEFRMPDGAAAVAAALDAAVDDAGRRPDAVLCLNDQLALGALRMLHERGLRVPEDVAVVGFDDVEGGRFSVPTLTTVAPDKSAVAAVAVELLLLRMAEAAADRPTAAPHQAAPAPAPAPQERVVPHRLIVRESTAGRGRRSDAAPDAG